MEWLKMWVYYHSGLLSLEYPYQAELSSATLLFLLNALEADRSPYPSAR